MIEGFEEHAQMPAGTLHNIRDFAVKRPELFAGIWTWSRGGGWEGPYIKNELWPDLNAWVMAQWALNPRQSEEELFNCYAAGHLGLVGDEVGKFRRLCLLSAEAVIRGRQSLIERIDNWWTRDQYIAVPPLPKHLANLAPFLGEKDQAVARWREMVTLADSLHFPDAATGDYVKVSCRYGLHLYRVYDASFHLAALGVQGKPDELRKWIAEYDAAWADLRRLAKESEQCATLYRPRHSPWHPNQTNLDEFIDRLRASSKKQP